MAAFLLLDADRNFRRALEIELRLDGARVTSGGSAVEALPLAQRGAFDLVLVDSVVPGADALLQRATDVGLPTIATGLHRELLDRAARRYRVATLEKPFSAAALLALCRATTRES
jgi:DNA-binding NtrC family response regulator